MAYMIIKDGKIIGRKDEHADAFMLIEHDFNPKKHAVYSIRDLKTDATVCIESLMRKLQDEARKAAYARQKGMRRPLPTQRRPLKRSAKPIRRSPINRPASTPAPKARKPRKRRKNDLIDEEYSAWLGTQPCVITGRTAERGSGPDNIHCHHIHGRVPRNDHLQVPLLGRLHSWGPEAYHQLGKESFARRWRHVIPDEYEDTISYFEAKARQLKRRYDKLQAKEKLQPC